MISSNSAGVSSANSANCLANLIFSLNKPHSSPERLANKMARFLLAPFGPVASLNLEGHLRQKCSFTRMPSTRSMVNYTVGGDMALSGGGYVEKCTTLLEWVRRYRGNEPAGY